MNRIARMGYGSEDDEDRMIGMDGMKGVKEGTARARWDGDVEMSADGGGAGRLRG
jgi:hypothetical protein